MTKLAKIISPGENFCQYGTCNIHVYVYMQWHMPLALMCCSTHVMLIYWNIPSISRYSKQSIVSSCVHGKLLFTNVWWCFPSDLMKHPIQLTILTAEGTDALLSVWIGSFIVFFSLCIHCNSHTSVKKIVIGSFLLIIQMFSNYSKRCTCHIYCHPLLWSTPI